MTERSTGLYFIKDLVSGVPTSKIIQSVNDTDALRGFKEYVKDEKISPKEMQLVRIAYINDDNKVINDTYYPICTGDKAEEMYNVLVDGLIANEVENV